jgi:hypothetical protein
MRTQPIAGYADRQVRGTNLQNGMKIQLTANQPFVAAFAGTSIGLKRAQSFYDFGDED